MPEDKSERKEGVSEYEELGERVKEYNDGVPRHGMFECGGELTKE